MEDHVNFNQQYETERLIIRPTLVEDASFMFELMNSTGWITNIGDRNVGNIDEAKKYIIDKMYPQLKEQGYTNYTVIRKSDESKIGTVGLYKREGLTVVDIGFAFLEDFMGQGYAYEASLKIKEVAKGVFGIEKLSGITIEENMPSRKLLEKLGFVFIKNIRIPNDPEELMYYETEELR